MTNVQAFAATPATPRSSGWWATRLLDPMASSVLLAVLRSEQTDVVEPPSDDEPVASGSAAVNAVRPQRSFADYFAADRAAWQPGIDVTPARVRKVTGCPYGLSSRLAELREHLEAVEVGW